MTLPKAHSTAPDIRTVTPEFYQDPYPLLKDLMEAGPVARLTYPDGLGVERRLITRHEDVIAALGDARLSSEVARRLPGLLPKGTIPLSLRSNPCQ